MIDSEGKNLVNESEERDEVTKSFPPSHILQDGRFIFLPDATDAERSKFLERSIARHKLIDKHVKEDSNQETKEEESEKEKKDTTQPKVHPLALASARLQANGISELSKAVNLTSLVSAGEYFGLSNIVNPMLEVGVKKRDTKEDAAGKADAENDLALRALYLGKRKRAQFEWACSTLERHGDRVAGTATIQRIVDSRLLTLRPRWRLVAPEHGTRARGHATRPTEVVAIDVDVYDRDRTGGGNQALLQNQLFQQTLGRLARRVPRYATVELPKDYIVKRDVTEWKSANEMDIVRMDTGEEQTATVKCKTRAEPFAVADPTLGKIDVDFDPEKVPMLSLQFDIEKDSTGFRQCERLMPLTTLGEDAHEDEKVIVALQHSLFCASLFESIRGELLQEEDVDELASRKLSSKHYSEVWLSSAMEENFLPPSSLMVGGGPGGRGALSVVHCHEGEVKVQLDCEYALTAKLVEAGTAVGGDNGEKDKNGSNNDDVENDEDTNTIELSGSQSPQQLHALCKALLAHAQEVYHKHSIAVRELAAKKYKEAQEKKTVGLETKRKKDELPQAQILQECVGLGVNLLFERKIRRTLCEVQRWLRSLSPEASMTVEWLPFSIFDPRSQFVLTFQSFIVDVSIERDEMTVTRFGENSEYRKVQFHMENEFESYLKLEFRKNL
mmetsp:Transcript_20816/g.30815  ORF Transcript_20816/g.30815 Transcript_20816/m.30815 type:complete len:671 (-) Transcript_20816:1473-3485(-)